MPSEITDTATASKRRRRGSGYGHARRTRAKISSSAEFLGGASGPPVRPESSALWGFPGDPARLCGWPAPGRRFRSAHAGVGEFGPLGHGPPRPAAPMRCKAIRSNRGDRLAPSRSTVPNRAQLEESRRSQPTPRTRQPWSPPLGFEAQRLATAAMVLRTPLSPRRAPDGWAPAADRRRRLTNTRVVRFWLIRSAVRRRSSPQQCVAGPGAEARWRGTSTAMSLLVDGPRHDVGWSLRSRDLPPRVFTVREADALRPPWGLRSAPTQRSRRASVREGQVRAAFIAANRVDFIDDDGADVSPAISRRLGAVSRMLERIPRYEPVCGAARGPLLSGRSHGCRVAGYARRADWRHGMPRCVRQPRFRRAARPDSVDVIAEILERGDLNDFGPGGPRTQRAAPHHAIDPR